MKHPMHRVTELFLKMSLVLIATTGPSFGIDKHWLPDLEWQTGSNWVDNLLPDADSSVIFPEQTWHIVGLPNSRNIEIAKIYLPIEGSLALGSNAVLTFNEIKKPEKYVKWAKKGLYLWIDPENWDGYNEATPHADRIPCDNDIVVLPNKNRILNIALPNVEVQVTAVRIADEKTPLSKWKWREIANQPREFISNRLTVTYTNKNVLSECIDCICHKDDSIANEICSYMWQGDKCEPPVCEYSLQVDGHCCAFCGARLRFSHLASVENIVTRVNETLDIFHDVLSWHVRKMLDGNTEVLIVEKGEYSGINSREAVDVLSKRFIGEGFEILIAEATGFAVVDSSMKTVLGPLLGIPVILMFLLLVIFPYYGYTYSQVFSAWREAFTLNQEDSPMGRKSGGTFGFARFKNVAEGDVDLAENIVAEEAEALEVDSDVDGPSSSSKRFENPLYRSARDIKTGETVIEKKIIDIDSPLSLSALESRIREDSVEELTLE